MESGQETAVSETQQTDSEAATRSPTRSPTPAEKPANAMDDRKARFAALKARNTVSRKANLAETKSEHSRLTTDTSALTALNRKRDIAAHKILKADTEAAGEDFERKRAWDWTIEESEKWDKRTEKKAKHRENNAFQDYGDQAHKTYKRQLQQTKPDLAAYEQEKAEMMERAAKGGGLEMAETAGGELIAVDRDGKFFSTAENTDFVNSRPSKEAIDRLVGDLQKAEDTRRKKRARRAGEGDDDDVTYINDKNKQFNRKLARFYDHYTKEIRDSFERGTAI